MRISFTHSSVRLSSSIAHWENRPSLITTTGIPLSGGTLSTSPQVTGCLAGMGKTLILPLVSATAYWIFTIR